MVDVEKILSQILSVVDRGEINYFIVLVVAAGNF